MFRGSMVALVTPMKRGITPDSPIDWDALRGLVEYHIQEGTDVLVAVGTTGESATLDEAEHCEVIRFVVEHARGRVPVIAGTGANATSEAITLTHSAKNAGADACLLVTPYYNKPTQEGLYLHYKAVAEAVAIPQILYNVPGRTACDMLPETIIRLSTVPNIVGVKEATGDLKRLEQLRAACPSDFLLISGDDATAMEFLLQGGHGVITVTGNVAPRVMHEMCAAGIAGDRERAVQFNNKLEALHRDLFVEANPIPAKWCVYKLGLIEAGIRLPLTWLSESQHGRLEAAMQAAGVLPGVK